MIKVAGRVRVVNEYSVTLPIAEEAFYKLTHHEQNQMIEQAIDFSNVTVVDIEVDDDADITPVEG